MTWGGGQARRRAQKTCHRFTVEEGGRHLLISSKEDEKKNMRLSRRKTASLPIQVRQKKGLRGWKAIGKKNLKRETMTLTI